MFNTPDAATAALDGFLDSEEAADREENEFEDIIDDQIDAVSDDASQDEDFVQELIANHPEAVRAWADDHREDILAKYGESA